MHVVIAPASSGDAETIAAILLEAFREFEPFYTPGGYRATTGRHRLGAAAG